MFIIGDILDILYNINCLQIVPKYEYQSINLQHKTQIVK